MTRKTKKSNASYRLDLRFFLGGSLFTGSGLDVLERVLRESVGPWSSGLHLVRVGSAPRNLVKGEFAEVIQQAASEYYNRHLADAPVLPTEPRPRRFGSLEVRGSDGSLIVVVRLDEFVFAPMSETYIWGNTISLQFCERDCCGKSAADQALAIMEVYCREVQVFHAAAQTTEEWFAKNMDLSHGVRAIGVDVSKFLPGLYWLNYFGAPYCDMIGRERLLNAPAFASRGVGDGVMLRVDEEPEMWKSEETNYPDVLSHIGDRYFFLRDQPNRATEAPNFGLEPRPPFRRVT